MHDLLHSDPIQILIQLGEVATKLLHRAMVDAFPDRGADHGLALLEGAESVELTGCWVSCDGEFAV